MIGINLKLFTNLNNKLFIAMAASGLLGNNFLSRNIAQHARFKSLLVSLPTSGITWIILDNPVQLVLSPDDLKTGVRSLFKPGFVRLPLFSILNMFRDSALNFCRAFY